MSETTSITSDQIEALAAKVDAGGALDDHDQTVLRGVFFLAGRAVALEADVEGFAAGAPGVFSLHVTPAQLGDGSVRSSFAKGHHSQGDFHFTHLYDKSSPTLG